MTSSAVDGAGSSLPKSQTLLIHIVDHLATTKPQALYAEFPISAVTYEEGFRKVTYGAFANAINGIAWWLHDALGPGKNYETLAYIGPNNFVYPCLILGAVKAGYKVLLLSPRNNVPAQLYLLQATNCKTFLACSPYLPSVAAILAAHEHGLRILETPTVENLLKARVPNYPYNKNFEEACNEPLVVMHTSGSTGFPKPIIWTNGFCAAYAASLQLSPPPGFESVDTMYEGNRIFVMFPPFHAAYVAHVLVNGIGCQSSVILPLQSAIPSAESLSGALKNTKIDAAFVVPSILEEMSKSPELLDYISANIDTIVYSGGDLPLGCGNVVASRTQLINFYGSTEGASLPLIRREAEMIGQDWKYLHIHPDAGVEFRQYTDNMYELFIVRHHHLEGHQQIFKTFPDIQEFQTRDLFVPHPSKPNRWSHCGRSDDIVVLLNGEKMYPVPMEQHIFASHRDVSGVIIAGSQRFQTALLIELKSKEKLTLGDKANMVEEIWPSIEEANKECPAHARIAKSHIIFIPPTCPMIRTPKGTIMRAASLAQYTKELDMLYANADKVPDHGNASANIDLQDSSTVLLYLRETVSEITGSLDLQDDDNFFVQGIDSLQALLITRQLKQSLNLPDLAISTIYANPSIRSLAEALQLASGLRESTPKPLYENSSEGKLDALLTAYCELVDRIPSSVHRVGQENGNNVFLLTGSTGALGSYLLESLLAAPEVAHVFCLNRSVDSAALQVQRNKSRGLTMEFPEDKVTFLYADLSKANLGLQDEVYTTLLETVTTIIHSAWPVNFNISVTSFQPHLKGVVNLARFASEGLLSPTFLYISSISAVSNLRTKNPSLSKIPEEIVEDGSAPAAMGYGESKYLSERILNYATKKLKVKIKIARVGQIAGSINGATSWNRAEWFPSLIISSLYVGALPESLGRDLDKIEWIPIDVLADILLELCQTTQDDGALDGANVFNVMNPHLVEWRELLPAVIKTLSSLRDGKTRIGTMTFKSWIAKVAATMDMQPGGSNIPDESRDRNIKRLVVVNPAVKLLGFYCEEEAKEERSEWETGKAEERSGRLRALGRVEDVWVAKWIRSWFT